MQNNCCVDCGCGAAAPVETSHSVVQLWLAARMATSQADDVYRDKVHMVRKSADAAIISDRWMKMCLMRCLLLCLCIGSLKTS